MDPSAYYDACIEEACACDMEGKYLGFCTAVAMYAEACSAVGVCVTWRKPDLCRKWGPYVVVLSNAIRQNCFVRQSSHIFYKIHILVHRFRNINIFVYDGKNCLKNAALGIAPLNSILVSKVLTFTGEN